jgi:hypothetical protein
VIGSNIDHFRCKYVFCRNDYRSTKPNQILY